MVKKPEITLEEARAKIKPKKTTFQASDLIDKDRLRELREKAKKSAQDRNKKKLFDKWDAYSAEIVARFGYDVYQKWNEGEIEIAQMDKWLNAERARDKGQLLNLEAIIIALVSSCVKYYKGEKKPTGPSEARKIYQEEAKIAKGEF